MGSAEYSTIGVINSHFHKIYGMYNYDTLFYSMTYIERGLFGLAWYALFYLLSLKKAYSTKSVNIEDVVLLKKNIICVIVAFLLSFYDDSLRRASGGFIMFFVLAIPYVIAKQHRTREVEKKVL